MTRVPFQGVVNVDIRDSKPDWAPFEPPKAPDGVAECRLHRPRRRRLLRDELLRRADRHSEHRPDRRRRGALHAMAHHRTVLADALLPADRPQPHAQLDGVHHGGSDRIPQREWHDPAGERDALRDPRRARLEHVHGRQVAPVPRRRDERRVDPAELAERPRVRALVRLSRRRDEPVVPRSRLRQPPGRPAEVARGGLPLLRGHHRQGDRVHQGCEGRRPREAVLPLLRARRGPRATPRAQGVGRQVQGSVRHGLRSNARADAGEAEGTGNRPREDRVAADQPNRDRRDANRPRRPAVPHDGRDPSLGLALGRRAAIVQPDGRGVRGVPLTRRPPDRAPARLPRGDR